jgi:hypothetical protein
MGASWGIAYASVARRVKSIDWPRCLEALGFYCLIEPVVFIADYRKGPERHFPPVPLDNPIFG